MHFECAPTALCKLIAPDLSGKSSSFSGWIRFASWKRRTRQKVGVHVPRNKVYQTGNNCSLCCKQFGFVWSSLRSQIKAKIYVEKSSKCSNRFFKAKCARDDVTFNKSSQIKTVERNLQSLLDQGEANVWRTGESQGEEYCEVNWKRKEPWQLCRQSSCKMQVMEWGVRKWMMHCMIRMNSNNVISYGAR